MCVILGFVCTQNWISNECTYVHIHIASRHNMDSDTIMCCGTLAQHTLESWQIVTVNLAGPYVILLTPSWVDMFLTNSWAGLSKSAPATNSSMVVLLFWYFPAKYRADLPSCELKDTLHVFIDLSEEGPKCSTWSAHVQCSHIQILPRPCIECTCGKEVRSNVQTRRCIKVELNVKFEFHGDFKGSEYLGHSQHVACSSTTLIALGILSNHSNS